MLLKVLLILSLVFITITESLIAYYELEDEETRRPAAAAHHRQPQPQHHSRLSSEMTEEAAAEDDKPLSSPLLFTRMARQDMRICGTQLLKGLMKICGGCVKTPGNDNATTKRSGFWSSPHKRDTETKITVACCKNKCSHEYLKSFCC